MRSSTRHAAAGGLWLSCTALLLLALAWAAALACDALPGAEAAEGRIPLRIPGPVFGSGRASPVVFRLNATTPGCYASGFAADKGGAVTVTRATTATYLDGSGVRQTCAAGSARVESTGLLVEPARTNLALQGGQIQNAPWTAYAFGAGIVPPTVTANAGVAPDGTNTATQIDITTAVTDSGKRSIVYQTMTGTASVAYTNSLWLKGVSGSGTTCVEAGDGGGVDYAVNACSYNSATWTRCAATLTTSDTNKAIVFGADQLVAAVNAGCPTQGIQSFYVWGGQAELGSYATSYIPTTTVAVARNADAVSVAGMPDISVNGCVGATFDKLGDGTTYFYERVFGFNSSNASPMILHGAIGSTAYYGDNTYAYTIGIANALTPQRLTANWANTTGYLQTSVTTATGGHNVGAFSTSTVWLGSDRGTASHLGGHLQNIVMARRAGSCR